MPRGDIGEGDLPNRLPAIDRKGASTVPHFNALHWGAQKRIHFFQREVACVLKRREIDAFGFGTDHRREGRA
ncbi:MAG: hypothetical protein OTJ45_00455 [Alphaproteobacteria bacterium]|nr:hypothetical protein [Alphaproteobacteria bacterium]